MIYEFLANRVEITVRLRRETNRVMDDTYVRFAVDGDGHVSILDAADFADYRRKVDILVDEFGVAEWKRIGPEDSEPYLTDEWLDRTFQLRAPLSNGMGWTKLAIPEGLA